VSAHLKRDTVIGAGSWRTTSGPAEPIFRTNRPKTWPHPRRSD